jgi:hypothetical protein
MRREDNMHIGLIILFIWFIGYILSIHPIYNALVRQRIAYTKKRSASYSDHQLQQGDVVNNMVGASLLAVFWFLAIPYVTSHFIYKKGKPSLEAEVDTQVDDFEHRQQLKSQMAKARKEIEASYISNNDIINNAIDSLRSHRR